MKERCVVVLNHKRALKLLREGGACCSQLLGGCRRVTMHRDNNIFYIPNNSRVQ